MIMFGGWRVVGVAMKIIVFKQVVVGGILNFYKRE